jgi:hypothetical protein
MLSINECKRLLNNNGQKYTTEQATEIRDILNKLAEVIYSEKTKDNEVLSRKASCNIQKS